MGMGMDRHAWFSMNTPTIYEASFPTVIKKLKDALELDINEDLMKRFVPFAGILNVDEVENIEKTWQEVAEKTDSTVDQLKKNIQTKINILNKFLLKKNVFFC